MLSDLKFRLRALFARRAVERELDDELRFHIERETEKYVRDGLPRHEAERRAQMAFGGVERIKDDTRDARGLELIDSISQDIRYAWRGIRVAPGFAVAVALTLGLGVGANVALFGVVDRLLFRPPSYLVDAERVHRPFVRYRTPARERVQRVIQYTRYRDFVRWTSSFDRAGAMAVRTYAVGTAESTREMPVAAISASIFGFFDAQPVIGRFFTAAEDSVPVGAPVAVLSHAFWQSRFGGQPDAMGALLQVDRVVYTVIGVAPEDFVAFAERESPSIFVPVTAVAGARNQSYFRNYEWTWLEMFVRRKPGVTVAQANADLTAAFLRSWATEDELESMPPLESARPSAEVSSLHLSRTPDAGADARTLVWVMGVAGVVLLLACANVANLLLARAITRRREIAVRLALGVSRRRLMQQLLVEGMALAMLGGAVGVLIAQWGSVALSALFFPLDGVGLVTADARTLVFAAGVTVLVAVLTAFAPALQARRADVSDALKSGSRGAGYRRSRLRSALLVFQGAVCVVLLVGAGLFVRSLWNVKSMRLGYDVAPIIFAEVNPRGTRLTTAELTALNERVLQVVRDVPGIESATLTVSVPFWSNEGRGMWVPGRDSLSKLGNFLLQAGSPEYFETMGTRILRGRGFSESDRAGSEPVAVVSDNMARVLWPGEDAIGKYFRIQSDTAPLRRVVGIAEHTRQRLLADNREFWYFIPMGQYIEFDGPNFPAVFARVSGNADARVEPVRRAVQEILPGIAYVTARPLKSLVAPSQRSWEFGATMFLGFGALALVLAAIGLYSVIAYAVAQRTRELGVRIALGASMSAVMGMIVRQGMLFALSGILIGSAIALLAGRWLAPLLFDQSPRDPLIYGSVAILLLLVAMAATIVPAMRATRVSPTEALRAD